MTQLPTAVCESCRAVYTLVLPFHRTPQAGHYCIRWLAGLGLEKDPSLQGATVCTVCIHDAAMGILDLVKRIQSSRRLFGTPVQVEEEEHGTLPDSPGLVERTLSCACCGFETPYPVSIQADRLNERWVCKGCTGLDRVFCG